MPLLTGLRVLQAGPGLAAAVAGRMLADLGATVAAPDAPATTALEQWLAHGKGPTLPGVPDLVIRQGTGSAPCPGAAEVVISPFGQDGPDAGHPATDLTLLAASGMMRLLTGQVDDISEPPLRPVGQQSAVIAGLAAACAGIHAAILGPGASVDVSMQEALATLAMTELTRAGQTGRGWRRLREGDGNGATVCILPASDGYVAISPREDRQWASWLIAMGSPAWGAEPRFRTKADRAANWDALHALMSEWSRTLPKRTIAAIAQDAHVPSFPLMEVQEHLASEQLAHRGFFRDLPIGGRTVRAPGSPFGLSLSDGARRPLPGPMPLSGVRVLDFSWVIAGPTTTRYLAAMGADVIKVEAPGRGDPGRASELHTVLGQAKRAIVLDLKRPEAVALARELAARCDVLIENFATGVMDRLGLGAEELRAGNPDLVYVSASGLGRTGPEAQAVAYGTLLQSYAGFAGLNRHSGREPRIGFAWADPMCALMLATVTAAALWRRAQAGGGARVDFSMIEAMLWTMAEPVLAAQTGGPPRPRGNASDCHAPHGVFPCAGDDQWVALAGTDAAWPALRRLIPGLSEMTGPAAEAAITAWTRARTGEQAAALLRGAGVAAEVVAGSLDLLRSAHLAARGFWDRHGSGVLPSLPWQASFGRIAGPAPGLGEHTDAVLAEVLGLGPDRIAALRAAGALG